MDVSEKMKFGYQFWDIPLFCLYLDLGESENNWRPRPD